MIKVSLLDLKKHDEFFFFEKVHYHTLHHLLPEPDLQRVTSIFHTKKNNVGSHRRELEKEKKK